MPRVADAQEVFQLVDLRLHIVRPFASRAQQGLGLFVLVEGLVVLAAQSQRFGEMKITVALVSGATGEHAEAVVRRLQGGRQFERTLLLAHRPPADAAMRHNALT